MPSLNRTYNRGKGRIGMITRVWQGWTSSQNAARYERHYRTEVVPGLRQIAGFRGARLLRRTVGDETEFVSLTAFDDLDAIRSFAGPDYETAVVADDARDVLVRFDLRVRHYEDDDEPAPGQAVISLMLAVQDAPAAAAWYRQALGAVELWNLGSVIGLEVEGATLLIGQSENNGWESPTVVGTTTVRVEVFVADPDSFIERAVAAGADGTVDPVRNHQAPWGTHRQGGFVDPFGHRWLVGDKSPLGRT
jgi:PhnB protein